MYMRVRYNAALVECKEKELCPSILIVVTRAVCNSSDISLFTMLP
jgi:hypothetical protein